MSIEKIVDYSAHQLESQFMVSFSKLPNCVNSQGLTADDLQYLVRGSFEIPQMKVQTYDEEFRGMKVTLPGGKDDSDKNGQIEFRLDENWFVYDVFYQWFVGTFDPLNGYRKAMSDITTDMTITAYSAGGNPTKIITFYNTIVYGLKTTDFDNTGNKPISVKVDYSFTHLNPTNP